MSDKLENFIQNNREKFDQQIPDSEVWNNINAGLAQQAAAGASASASTATAAKGGLAKIATAWKVAATAIAALAVGTAIFFSLPSEKEDATPAKSQAPFVKNDSEPNKKVEFIEAASPLVNPPLPKADIDFYRFTVDGKKGGKWFAPTGTILSIPNNTFVDGNGNPVKGDVDIQYREFHDAADIILAGIPMTYDDNGKIEHFQTAGMMEIQGFQNGRPVYIAEGKEVTVSIASFTGEDNYNLYFLDPEQKGWVDIGKAEIQPNKKKQEGLKVVANVPKAPVPPTKGTPGVEMENELTFAVDYKKYPELKPFRKVRWEVAEAGYVQKNQWIFTKTWNDVELIETDSETMAYQIVLQSRRKKVAIAVKPILEGADYEKAMAKFSKKKARYERLKLQASQERARLQAQADILRSFPISGFGIYNCDRFWGSGLVSLTNLEIEFPEDIYVKADQTIIYQIAGEDRAVVTHELHRINKLGYTPGQRTFLIAILPGNKLGLFSPKDFDALDVDKVKSGAKMNLKMKVIDKEINSAVDLRAALDV